MATFRAEVRQQLDPGSQALLESQTGPHASRAFTTISTIPYHLFRLLLLRRLRLPLPLSARFCRCRRTLDSLGDHRAACAQSGLLRPPGGGPLERAAAHICREAGARVTTNTRLVDLNLEHIDRQDDKKNRGNSKRVTTVGGGNQLAVDTTLVSPLTREGVPRQRGGTFAGTALRDARRRKEHRTAPLPTLQTGGFRCFRAGQWEAGGVRRQLPASNCWHSKPSPGTPPTLYHNSINSQVVSALDTCCPASLCGILDRNFTKPRQSYEHRR